MFSVQLIFTNFFYCFYLCYVHIKECTFDIFAPKSTGITKKELINVEIQEQTASLPNISPLNFQNKIISKFPMFPMRICQ